MIIETLKYIDIFEEIWENVARYNLKYINTYKYLSCIINEIPAERPRPSL